MKISRRIILVIFQIIIVMPALAQDISEIFDDIVLRIDTNEFSYNKNQVLFKGKPHLAFSFIEPETVCEVELFPVGGLDLNGLALNPSGDFRLIDSLLIIKGSSIRFKVRFVDLVNSSFLKFSFSSPETSERGLPWLRSTSFPIRLHT